MKTPLLDPAAVRPPSSPDPDADLEAKKAWMKARFGYDLGLVADWVRRALTPARAKELRHLLDNDEDFRAVWYESVEAINAHRPRDAFGLPIPVPEQEREMYNWVKSVAEGHARKKPPGR